MSASEHYSARIWRRFGEQPGARWSLRLIALLGLLALGADFVANEKPLALRLDGEWYAPLLIDYGVAVGVRRWPQPLLNADYRELAQRADLAWFPPIPWSPTRIDITGAVFAPPSAAHWLGTDALGRDVAAGMVHGTRISLTIGFVVVGIQALIGIVLGALAGYYAGAVDLVISRFIEMMLGIPVFFLLITIAAIFPPSLYLVMVILGLTGWMGIARYMRSEFLKVRTQQFVEAARGLGGSDARVMFRHILPNALAPVLVSMSFGVAGAILAESSLSFLGIGVPAHLVTWGSILSVARQNTFAWWLAVFPGAAIFATVTAYNLVGDGLQNALDPRAEVRRRA